MLQVRKVLFPTDFSDCARQALPQALDCTNRFGADLHMLHATVLHDYDPYVPGKDFPDTEAIYAALKEHSEGQLADLSSSIATDRTRVETTERRGTAPGPVILDYAAQENIDLIVMATHGRRGLRHLFLGSVAEEVVRHARCPVLTLRQGEESRTLGQARRILAPVDFSEHSQQAVVYAKEIAHLAGAPLDLLHVIHPPVYPVFYEAISSPQVYYESAELETETMGALEKLVAESDGPEVATRLHLAKGVPTEEILSFAKENESDLVVIATHGLTGLSHLLLGSVSEKVIGRAPCPVFSVKSFGKSLRVRQAA